MGLFFYKYISLLLKEVTCCFDYAGTFYFKEFRDRKQINVDLMEEFDFTPNNSNTLFDALFIFNTSFAAKFRNW